MDKNILFLFAFSCLLITACQKEPTSFGDYARPDLPDQLLDYKSSDEAFESLFLPDFTPVENELTDAGATLGRVLFYDRMLSVNNSTSCGSCHFQSRAFADFASSSDGFRGGKTSRNSMAIANTRGLAAFFWDMRSTSLEEQVLMPVKDHLEMGMERIGDLEKKLAMIEYYPPLFESAYGDKEITNDRISKAMAQFLRSMVSADSKFDRGLQMGFSNFTSFERRGMELFESWDGAGCVNCHSGRNFDGWSGNNANIGLEMVYEDKGIPMPEAEGFFKVPSLRNVALTSPYMHDGRFETLEEVIEHYNSGVQPHPNLDWRLTDGNSLVINPFPVFPGPFPNQGEPKMLNLSDQDKEALVAFLHTLTDQTYTTDERYSDPF